MVLSSDVQKVCMEVDLWDDSTAEQEEGFFCVLSYSDSSYFPNSNLERPLATVMLEDNDGMYCSAHGRKYTHLPTHHFFPFSHNSGF